MKYCYLENTTDNHNKFYEMTENPGGKTFTSRYGKIGSTGSQHTYDMNDWSKLYDEKIKKDYVDVTPQNKKMPVTNQLHLKKVNKVYMLLNMHQAIIDRSDEHIRDVGAMRETLKNPEPPLNGSLSRLDMEYLNELWKKIHLTLEKEKELA